MRALLLSPPVVMIAFVLLVVALYKGAGALQDHSDETPGKHEPYACGEDVVLPEAQLAYHTFFRLALMFGILHVATLVLSTLPVHVTSPVLPVAYAVGVAIGVAVLTSRRVC
jgi:NADH:ubiquinone oxidoreductase subunit 3 (subunit A)